jgi:hypothetical protein
LRNARDGLLNAQGPRRHKIAANGQLDGLLIGQGCCVLTENYPHTALERPVHALAG